MNEETPARRGQTAQEALQDRRRRDQQRRLDEARQDFEQAVEQERRAVEELQRYRTPRSDDLVQPLMEARDLMFRNNVPGPYMLVQPWQREILQGNNRAQVVPNQAPGMEDQPAVVTERVDTRHRTRVDTSPLGVTTLRHQVSYDQGRTWVDTEVHHHPGATVQLGPRQHRERLDPVRDDQPYALTFHDPWPGGYRSARQAGRTSGAQPGPFRVLRRDGDEGAEDITQWRLQGATGRGGRWHNIGTPAAGPDMVPWYDRGPSSVADYRYWRIRLRTDNTQVLEATSRMDPFSRIPIGWCAIASDVAGAPMPIATDAPPQTPPVGVQGRRANLVIVDDVLTEESRTQAHVPGVTDQPWPPPTMDMDFRNIQPGNYIRTSGSAAWSNLQPNGTVHVMDFKEKVTYVPPTVTARLTADQSMEVFDPPSGDWVTPIELHRRLLLRKAGIERQPQPA
jgi:hypothetical protein